MNVLKNHPNGHALYLNDQWGLKSVIVCFWCIQNMSQFQFITEIYSNIIPTVANQNFISHKYLVLPVTVSQSLCDCQSGGGEELWTFSPRKADGETVPLLLATITLIPVSTNGTEKSMISERSSLIVSEPIAISARL